MPSFFVGHFWSVAVISFGLALTPSGGVTTIFEDIRGTRTPKSGHDTPGESYQPILLPVCESSELHQSELAPQTLIPISIVLYSDVLPARRLQQLQPGQSPGELSNY